MTACKSASRLVVSAFLCLMSCFAAPAAEIHVASTGNDAGADGSTAKPYREIRTALERSKPGDTLLVGEGRYAGFTIMRYAASAEKPLTIRAPGGNAEVVPTRDRKDNRDTIYIDGSSYVIIDGLRSFRANRAAIRIQGSNRITIRNCVFGNNERWGILTGHCDDLLIEDNECYGSVKEHGIYVGNSGDRPVIRGNRSHDNAGCGIHMNADLSCGGDGIISGAVVEGNVVCGNGRIGGGGINMDGVQDSVIRNNLLFGNHSSGITCFRGNGAAGPKGQKILNNTIVMARDARYCLHFGQTGPGNVVRNNILYNLNPVRGGLAYFAEADVANVDSACNVFSKEAPVVALNDWSTRRQLAEWQSTGHEKGSFVGTMDELFVDAAANDYRLKKGSPATGSGRPVDVEQVGKQAGTGALDIGCSPYPDLRTAGTK